MNLLQQIKDDSITARKGKVPTATFLVTLYSEAANIGKNKRNGESTDEEVISVLKKFKAGAETIIEAASKRQGHNDQLAINEAEIEISIIDDYLPKMMSVDELRTVIAEYIITLEDKSAKQMGNVMAYLKNTFPGLYDGGIASKLTKEYLV